LKRPSASWRPICSAVALTALAGIVAAACAPAETTIVDRLTDQVRRYPDMKVEDFYKFVHQAAFGNGHLITDEGAARGYLRSELDSVTADDKEPLIDPLSPDGSVVRINLRTFKARNLDVTKLGDVMIESAKKFTPDRRRFERWWDEVADAADRRKLPFYAATLTNFGAARALEDYPAVHHSAAYSKSYQPAYRVVLRDVYFAIFAP
jgi:hypothetical protein